MREGFPQASALLSKDNLSMLRSERSMASCHLIPNGVAGCCKAGRDPSELAAMAACKWPQACKLVNGASVDATLQLQVPAGVAAVHPLYACASAGLPAGPASPPTWLAPSCPTGPPVCQVALACSCCLLEQHLCRLLNGIVHLQAPQPQHTCLCKNLLLTSCATRPAWLTTVAHQQHPHRGTQMVLCMYCGGSQP